MIKKIPHFFKGYSRIGLTNKPIRQDDWNYGVEEGSDAVLTPDFLKSFPDSKLDQFHFTNPEDIKPAHYWSVLAKELAEFKKLIIQNLASCETQVVIGGDNCVTFSSFLAVLEKAVDPKKVGYIQFDSHGEINSALGSDSKNFHGMYMRPFFEKFDVLEIANLVPFKLEPAQALFIGDMILDGDELEFFSKQKFINITLGNFQTNKLKYKKLLGDFVSKYEYIHVNFDVDIFHQSISSATGIPEDGKWFLEEVLTLLEIISVHPKLSFDLSEVNPKKIGIGQTVNVAQTVLNSVLK